MITDAEFAEDYAENGISAIYDGGVRGEDFAKPSSELARFMTANDDLLEAFGEFLDLLDDIVDVVLDEL